MVLHWRSFAWAQASNDPSVNPRRPSFILCNNKRFFIFVVTSPRALVSSPLLTFHQHEKDDDLKMLSTHVHMCLVWNSHASKSIMSFYTNCAKPMHVFYLHHHNAFWIWFISIYQRWFDVMMGESAFYVNTTHFLVVFYVVVRKRLKEAIYILK
jgi:hypothetical protein